MAIAAWVVWEFNASYPTKSDMAIYLSNTRLASLAIFLGAVLLFLAVLIGAFGAHALTSILEQNQRVDVFETASNYHFYHGIGLLLIGALCRRGNDIAYHRCIILMMLFGTLIFSGALYCLAIFNIAWLGAVAPVGGTLLLFSWLLLAYSMTQFHNTRDDI